MPTSPPATKAKRRWTNAQRAVSTPPGELKGAIGDPEIAGLLGRICVAWPHLENEMISVFGELLGVARDDSWTPRLAFTAIINQKTRIDVMRELLERSPHNTGKSDEYDFFIDEFKKLNDLRNKYVHGRWWTHDSGDIYLQSDNSESFAQAEYRKVTVKELWTYLRATADVVATTSFEV